MNELKPIDTAPKDGRRIILAGHDSRIADGYWNIKYLTWVWPYIKSEPTHWMPMIKLPDTQK